jgi:hypothetical protein
MHVVQVQISLAVPEREQVELRGQIGDHLPQQLLGRRMNLVGRSKDSLIEALPCPL